MGHTVDVLELTLARNLRDAGVRWDPMPGDAFVIPDRDLDGHVFVLSDMVVQTLPVAGGRPVLTFNGTTEWALDSLDADDALWLPREDQLRTRLGGTFVALERMPSSAGINPAYVVTLHVGVDERETRHVDVSPEAAYARALLSLLD